MNPWEHIKKDLIETFKDKRIILVGFGKEGRSTYELLKQLDLDVPLTIMDQQPSVAIDYLATNEDSKTLVSPVDYYLKDLNTYDVVFKTPGLPSYLLEDVEVQKITSQSQLFMNYLSSRTIGITGTKGKSTTSSILKHVLEGAGLKVKLIGNIGFPALESLMDDDGETFYVYEMSSFQTEYLHIGPRYRIILNLFQEHLNNYTGYEAYQESKLQLFKASIQGQEKNLCIYGCDNTTLMDKIIRLKEQLFEENKKLCTTENTEVAMESTNQREFQTFGYSKNNVLKEDGYFIDNEMIIQRKQGVETPITSIHFSRKLLGEHNLINCLVSFILVDILNSAGVIDISDSQLIKLIGTFKGLHHRLEEVGTYHNITFYNDSISTIPEATMKAVDAIVNIGTLIIGGFDRTIDYSDFARYLGQLNRSKQILIICLPTTGHKIAELMETPEYCYCVETMDEAIQLAYKITKPNKACLLSPAASSFNQYKNFEDRGNHFAECVKVYGEANENETDENETDENETF